MDLGAALRDLGVKATSLPPVELQTRFVLDLSFGIRLDSRLAVDQAVFIKINQFDAHGTVAVANTGSGTPLDFAARIGFLGVAVNDATFSMTASLTGTPVQTQFTLRDIQSRSLADLVTFATTGSLSVNLPVTTTPAGLAAPATIQVTDNNLFDNVIPTPFDLNNNLNWNGLDQFLNLDMSAVASVFTQIGTAFDSLVDSDLFNANVSLTGLEIGDVLELAKSWQDRIVKFAQSNSPDSAQTLQQLLALLGNSAVGVRYNKDDGQLFLDVDFRHLISKQLPVGFAFSLGDLGGFTSSSEVRASAEAAFKFTIGLDIKDSIGEQFVLDNNTQLTKLYTLLGNADAASHTNWNKADRPGVTDAIRIELANGRTFDVNLDDKSTVGQIVAAINTAAASSSNSEYIEVALIDGRLKLIDKSQRLADPANQTPRTSVRPLRVSALNNS